MEVLFIQKRLLLAQHGDGVSSSRIRRLSPTERPISGELLCVCCTLPMPMIEIN